jgi:hypothetical protein
MIKRFALAVSVLAAFVSGAAAQGTTKPKSSLTLEVSQQFPDNTSGAITPANARQVSNDIVASYQQTPLVNAQTGSSYTFQVADYGKLVTFNSASAVAVTLPQAIGSFVPWNAYVTNLGAGVVTITPQGGSTINGATTFTLGTNAAVFIVSDGANYQVWGIGSGLTNPVIVGTSLYPIATGFEYNTTSALVANTLGAKNIVAGTPAATSTCCTWLNTYMPGIDSAGVFTFYGIMPPSTGSWFGTITAARSSDSSSGTPQSLISQTCAVLRDNTSVAHLTWCGYEQSNITSTAINGHHIGRESSIFNNGTALAEDPYNANPTGAGTSMVNHRFDCAQSGALGGNDCGAAIDILNNGAKFISGINIANNSLDTAVNTNPPAIQMPSAYALTWYNATASVTGRIYMDSGQKGWITPTAGTNITGTNTNDSAGAGQIGELISSTVNSPGSSVTNNTAANITSISLTAGDWDVDGQCVTIPAATTTVGQLLCSLSTTTATDNTTPGFFSEFSGFSQAVNQTLSQQVMPTRFSFASTTTVFLVVHNTFGTSTETAYGVIRARRVR